MADYDNKNRFALFKNDKGDNPNRPDYTGQVTLPDGTEMRMSAWVREAKSGIKYLSGSLSETIADRLKNAPDEPSGLDNAHVEGEDVPF
jgi:cytochrome c1